MSKPHERLILLRHGQTEWSESGQHTGVSDIPLTDRGEELAAALEPHFDALDLRDPLVLSSPRKRAIRTAELAGLEVSEIRDELSEWNYGEYEGITTPEIRQTVPGWTVWTHPSPGGESAAQVQARADSVLDSVKPLLAERDVVLVGHGHFSRVLIARWVELAASEGVRFAMGAPAYTVLGYERGVPQITRHNITPPGAH